MIFPKGGVEAESTILFGKISDMSGDRRGRSGTVFLAKHLGLDEFRAIKRVAKEALVSSGETAVLRNLRHPGIPIIYDMEEDSIFTISSKNILKVSPYMLWSIDRAV